MVSVCHGLVCVLTLFLLTSYKTKHDLGGTRRDCTHNRCFSTTGCCQGTCTNAPPGRQGLQNRVTCGVTNYCHLVGCGIQTGKTCVGTVHCRCPSSIAFFCLTRDRHGGKRCGPTISSCRACLRCRPGSALTLGKLFSYRRTRR